MNIIKKQREVLEKSLAVGGEWSAKDFDGFMEFDEIHFKAICAAMNQREAMLDLVEAVKDSETPPEWQDAVVDECLAAVISAMEKG